MHYNEYEWQSTSGLKLFAQSWSTQNEPEAIICLVHGLGEHSGRYAHMAAYLIEHGFAVITYDLCGHGRSEGQRGHVQSFDTYMDDIDLLVEKAGDQYPGKLRFLYGHSLGGLLVLNYALRRKADLAGVVASGAGLKSEVQNQTFKVALSKMLGMVVPKLSMPSGLEANMISRDPEVVEAYVNDPLVHDRATVGLAKNSFDAIDWVYDNASNFDIPLLLMQGTEDRITFPEGSEEFANRVHCEYTLKLWPGLYHELHNEPEKEQVFEYLVEWLNKILNARDDSSRFSMN